MKITRKVLLGCEKKPKPEYHTNTFQGQEETTDTLYLLLCITGIKQKAKAKKPHFEISQSPVCDRNESITLMLTNMSDELSLWHITADGKTLGFSPNHYSRMNTIKCKVTSYEPKSQEETLQDQSAMSSYSNKP